MKKSAENGRLSSQRECSDTAAIAHGVREPRRRQNDEDGRHESARPEDHRPNAEASGARSGARRERPKNQRTQQVACDHEGQARNLGEHRERTAAGRFAHDMRDVTPPIGEILVQEVFAETRHAGTFAPGTPPPAD